MLELTWSWSAAPYFLCALGFTTVALAAAITRGDRVLRLGLIGAAASALPWAMCSGLVACTRDPIAAERVLRLGNGPVALLGPDLLVVLLGASGQLERFRWLSRVSAATGVALFMACWLSPTVIAGVHELPNGMFYLAPGPLTWVHFLMPGLWLAVGVVIAGRATRHAERRNAYALVAMLVCATLGGGDLLVVYGIGTWPPLAWVCGVAGSAFAMYMMFRTDFLRVRGVDRAALIELACSAAATVVIAYITSTVPGGSPLALALVGAGIWAIATASGWGLIRRRPVRVANERRLATFVAEVAELDDDASALAAFARVCKAGLAIETLAARREPLSAEVARWMVERGEPVAVADLATMRLGPLRPHIEAIAAVETCDVLIPLIDRDTVVAIIPAKMPRALRDDERSFVAKAARATARQLGFVALAHAAAREGETAREVELASAMRVQTAASRDAELGDWTVVSAYRGGARTTGAAWSASLLADGKLALLVMEAPAHGVPAALATAALAGAFAAAVTNARVDLDELVASVTTTADGAVRGGEPVGAFIAILDRAYRTIDYACVRHRGAHLVSAGEDPLARGTVLPLADGRGMAAMADGAMVVIGSSALVGASGWLATLREQAGLGPRFVTAAVERAPTPTGGDLLAIVARLSRTARS